MFLLQLSGSGLCITHMSSLWHISMYVLKTENSSSALMLLPTQLLVSGVLHRQKQGMIRWLYDREINTELVVINVTDLLDVNP